MQELSRDEKAEMWQILASVGQSKLFQESLNANNTGKLNITWGVNKIKLNSFLKSKKKRKTFNLTLIQHEYLTAYMYSVPIDVSPPW